MLTTLVGHGHDPADEGQRRLKRNARKSVRPMSVLKRPSSAMEVPPMSPSPERHQTDTSPPPLVTPEEKGQRKRMRRRKLKSGGNATLKEVDPLADSGICGEDEVGNIARGMSRESAYWSFSALADARGNPALDTKRGGLPHLCQLIGELHGWDHGPRRRRSAMLHCGVRTRAEAGSHRTRRVESGGCGALLPRVSGQLSCDSGRSSCTPL